MPYGHKYEIRHSATVSTAITVIQLASGATTPFMIVEAYAAQRGSTTSLQEEIGFVRKSAAATVTTGVLGTHVFKLNPGDPNPDLQLGTALTGVVASAEGTDTDIVYREGFNVLAGWRWQPVSEKRIIVRAASFIGLKFFTAPGSQNWDFGITIMELG